MCHSAKFYCQMCKVFICESGDEDGDYYFECCDNYNTCLREKFKNIYFVPYYSWCEPCLEKRKSRMESRKRRRRRQKV